MAAIELADGLIYSTRLICALHTHAAYLYTNAIYMVLMARNECSSHAIVIVLTNIIIIVCDSIRAHLKWKQTERNEYEK